mgnify:CR=1 FL=1
MILTLLTGINDFNTAHWNSGDSSKNGVEKGLNGVSEGSACGLAIAAAAVYGQLSWTVTTRVNSKQ